MFVDRCPFCGSELVQFGTVEDGKGRMLNAYVVCVDCDARGSSHYTCEAAANAWNKPIRSILSYPPLSQESK